ncbi:hypothetical protein XF35_01710 [Streptomyces platensis subsp. clarensis]|nr:hypothetical protein [Streptomyces platensis subsp. clarensis]
MSFSDNIFETDPDSKPAERSGGYDDDLTGKMSLGRQVNGKVTTLDNWRIAVKEQQTADALKHLFGGQSVETEATNDFYIDVLTERPKILAVIDGPEKVYDDGKLWINGVLTHHCDGKAFLSPPEKAGSPCFCPATMAERKAAAKEYRGPKPSIEITFRLADDPELGEFKLSTGSWGLVSVLHQVKAKLSRIGEPALVELEIEPVSFIAKNGPMKGKTVSYNQPKVTVLKSFNDAIADER